MKTKLFYYYYYFILLIILLILKKIEIIAKVNNDIITNIDLYKEYSYMNLYLSQN